MDFPDIALINTVKKCFECDESVKAPKLHLKLVCTSCKKIIELPQWFKNLVSGYRRIGICDRQCSKKIQVTISANVYE